MGMLSHGTTRSYEDILPPSVWDRQHPQAPFEGRNAIALSLPTVPYPLSRLFVRPLQLATSLDQLRTEGYSAEIDEFLAGRDWEGLFRSMLAWYSLIECAGCQSLEHSLMRAPRQADYRLPPVALASQWLCPTCLGKERWRKYKSAQEARGSFEAGSGETRVQPRAHRKVRLWDDTQYGKGEQPRGIIKLRRNQQFGLY